MLRRFYDQCHQSTRNALCLGGTGFTSTELGNVFDSGYLLWVGVGLLSVAAVCAGYSFVMNLLEGVFGP